MFIGEEVPEGATQVAGIAAFLASPFDYTKVNHGARQVVKPYRLLKEGDIVYADQILAMVDTAKSLGDLDMKRVKITAAKADYEGAKAISDEADNKLATARQLYSKNAIPLEDFRSAQLTRDKMYLDSISKSEAVKQAQIEETLSQTIYKQHEIRNKNSGVRSIIQKIYRQRGEAVKELEPVMQLLSMDPLGADARVDGEYSRRLFNGMLVTVEPSIVDSPPKVYRGHKLAVNCLAVTKDAANPLIVSGGEDRTVLVWQRFIQSPIREFRHHEPVKALVCSPRGAAGNLVLTGSADGSLRLYDLNNKNDDKALLKEIRGHDVAITALAFSADGKYFASGAADGSIILWDTAKMEAVYPFDEKHGVAEPHHGAVSALHFTPQCKLVSASLDNTLNVWSLKEKGATLDYQRDGRNGSVAALDVSSDGRWMLFDQGKTLQILSVLDGRLINTFQNPGGAIPFDTLALFSPDHSMLLTAGASEGDACGYGMCRPSKRAASKSAISPPASACRPPAPPSLPWRITTRKEPSRFPPTRTAKSISVLCPPARRSITIRSATCPLHFADGGLDPSTRQRTSVRVDVPNPADPASTPKAAWTPAAR